MYRQRPSEHRPPLRQLQHLGSTLLLLLIAVAPLAADHGAASGQSVLSLEAGFTQEIIGLSNSFMGGVAFTPDGDPWINDCGAGNLIRFDLQGVAPESADEDNR